MCEGLPTNEPLHAPGLCPDPVSPQYTAHQPLHGNTSDFNNFSRGDGGRAGHPVAGMGVGAGLDCAPLVPSPSSPESGLGTPGLTARSYRPRTRPLSPAVLKWAHRVSWEKTGLPGPQEPPQTLMVPSPPVREQRLPPPNPSGSPTSRLSGEPRDSRRGEGPRGRGLRGEGPGEAVGEGRGVSSINVVISSRKKPGPRGGPPPGPPRTPLSKNWRRLASPPPSASSSSSSSSFSSRCLCSRYSGGPPRARLCAGRTRMSSEDDHL